MIDYKDKNPSGYSLRAWTSPKAGNSAEQNEDAWSATPFTTENGGNGLLIAVSDGATEAIYSRQWARALVEAATPDWSRVTDEQFADRLSELRRRFSPFPAGQEIPWYARDKFKLQGSQATLLLAAVEPGPVTGTCEVSAVAIGDSGLFLFTKEGTVQSFPATRSSDVGVNPALVTSLERPLGPIERWSATMRDGDLLVLVTDALEKWLLQLLEQDAGERFLQLLNDLWGESESFTRIEAGPPPTAVSTIPAGSIDPAEESPREAGSSTQVSGSVSCSPDPAKSGDARPSGFHWLLERLHLLPHETVPNERRPDVNSSPIDSLAVTEQSTQLAEPTKEEPGIISVERSFDTFLDKCRGAESSPQMRNDDVTCVAVTLSPVAHAGSVKSSIGRAPQIRLIRPQSPGATREESPPDTLAVIQADAAPVEIDISDTLGLNRSQLRMRLGEPERIYRSVQPEGFAGFGPRPSWLAPGVKFETWIYKRPAGNEWYLYIVEPAKAVDALGARQIGGRSSEADGIRQVIDSLRIEDDEHVVADYTFRSFGAVY